MPLLISCVIAFGKRNKPKAIVNDGTLLAIYSVTKTEKVYDEDKKDLANEVTHFIAIKGYTDLRLDDNNKADTSEMSEVFGSYKTGKSLKSVIKGLEEGYSEVKR